MGEEPQKITFHDPCYLGRHNGVYNEPRELLKSSGIELLEMERSRNRSFCRGAGGGNIWKEEEEGEEPIHQSRLKEAESTGVEVLGTGCPFCMIMLRDAVNELNSKLLVRDVVELVAERIAK